MCVMWYLRRACYSMSYISGLVPLRVKKVGATPSKMGARNEKGVVADHYDHVSTHD